VRVFFVPPGPVRQLRDLTRARTAITRERSREARRLGKLPGDAGIKLSAVAPGIHGVSGRAMPEALIAGVIAAGTGAGMVPRRRPPRLMGRHHAPGSSESAGKARPSRTRPGNPCPHGALGAAAMACAQNPGTCPGAKYRRIAARRGPQKASVAVQHAMLIAIWNTGTNGAFCDDPGAGHLTRLNPDRARNRALRQLHAMGCHVTLERAS